MPEPTALLRLAALCIPLTYAVAAVWAPREGTAALWRRTGLAAALAAGLALLVAAGSAVLRPPPLLVRLDAVTSVMLLLVCSIALVIQRFSRTYLDGDPGQARYARWLLATLAAVTTLIVANHLVLLGLAWVATSLALHQLLTFYEDRPQALVAAHKKFIASRVADLCLFGALALLGVQVGSLELDAVEAWARATPALPAPAQLAAVLLVLGASLKCAQLPFHGWLIQVMEAPTPVSALLHAGVVNIGGFVLIRLAPLMAKAPAAQTLLVVIGTASAVLAALVMTTRVSVKVMLAWSTCAQMGFMLVQCGLGAYSLALLHLVAHSLYKAHAFLSSGSTVETWRAQALAPAKQPASLAASFVAAAVALLGVGAMAVAVGAREEPALWAFGLVLALAVATLATAGGRRLLGATALAGAGVAALYFTWHAAFARLFPAPASGGGLGLRLGIVASAFCALFVVQAVLRARPHGRLARALYPRLFAGLYLDELFTRLTFRLWPPKLPKAPRRTPALHSACVVEA